YGWTQTHGFFAIMGGFQVCKPDNPSKPKTLHPDDICPYLENHDIVISKEEIMDRSKGDILAKCLVLIQVTWFILQVLARAIQHLAISELEIVTLAFALLNLMIYFCWWNKPLDVSYPIQITTYHEPIRRRMTMFGGPLDTGTEENPAPHGHGPKQEDLGISNGNRVPIDPGDSPLSYNEVFLEQHFPFEPRMTIVNRFPEASQGSADIATVLTFLLVYLFPNK
ncbi:hypothetical protein C0995_016211, partial [Termitomyces sp. Mi166